MLKKFVKGLLFGTTVGGLVATALAPKSGKATRQGIADQVTDTKESVVTIGSSLKGVMTHSQEVKEELANTQQVVADTQEKLAAFKFEATPRLEEISNQLKKIQSHLNK